MSRHTNRRAVRTDLAARLTARLKLDRAVVEALERRQYLTAVEEQRFDHNVLPHRLDIEFDGDVSPTLGAEDLYLTNLSWGEQVGPSQMRLAYDGATNTAHFTFPGPFVAETFLPSGQLKNGYYAAELLGANVTGTDGQPLDNDTFQFFTLVGDANRDGSVGFNDYVRIDLAYNNHDPNFHPTWENGDFNGDGKVNFDDYTLIDNNYGVVLPAPLTGPNAISVSAAIGNDSIDVQWTPPTGIDVDGYHIYRSLDGVTYSLIQPVTGATSDHWVDTTIEEGTKYTYRVRAYQTVDVPVDRSPTFTEVASTDSASAVSNLKGPIDLGYSDVTSDGVTLTWPDNSQNETGYEIWQMTAGGQLGQRLATLPAHSETGVISYPLEGLNPSTTYKLTVRAVSQDATSMPARAVEFTTKPGILGPSTGQEGTPLTYSAHAVAGTGGVWEVRFRKTPNSASVPFASGTGSTFTFTPDDDGEYRIELTTLVDNKPSSTVRKISVTNAAPRIAELSGPTRANDGHAVHFNSAVTDAGKRDVMHYAWSVTRREGTQELNVTLGTNTRTDLPTFSFVPVNPTTTTSYRYTVHLSVSDGDGATVSESHALTVDHTNNGPQAPGTTLKSALTNMSYTLPDDSEHSAQAAEAMFVQPDGKIVTVGDHFFIARYNPDLTLDTAFGDPVSIGSSVRKGWTHVPFFAPAATAGGNPTERESFANAVTVDRRGRIIVVGGVGRTGPRAYDDLAVVRLTSNGTLDKSFHNTGKYVERPDAFGTSCIGALGRTVALVPSMAPDGTGEEHIIVGGTAVFNGPMMGMAIAAFDDRGIELGGRIESLGDEHQIHSLAIQPDGKIVAGCEAPYRQAAGEEFISEGKFTLLRYTYTETITGDAVTASFGLDGDFQGGTVELQVGQPQDGFGDILKQVLVQPDGKIVAVGATDDRGFAGDQDVVDWVGASLQGGGTIEGGGKLAIARFLPDGSPDLTFGDQVSTGATERKGYVVVSDIPGAGITATLQPAYGGVAGSGSATEYKIVVGGAARRANGHGDFYLARFDGTGTLESGFGVNQTDYYTFDEWNNDNPLLDGTDAAMSIAIVGDSIVAAGGASDAAGNPHFAVLKYRPAQHAAIKLTATAAKNGSVNLAWLDGMIADEGYAVERADESDPDAFEPIASMDGSTLRFVDTSVERGKSYYYRVTALEVDGTPPEAVLDDDRHSNVATVATLPDDVGYRLVDTVVFGQPEVLGAPIDSHVALDDGYEYLLRASGTFDLGYHTDGTRGLHNDAEYAYFNTGAEDWAREAWPGPNKANWGVAINDNQTGHTNPVWGTPVGAYTYEIGYVGAGQHLTFHIDDGYYPDNRLVYPKDAAPAGYLEGNPLQIQIYRQLPTTPATLTASIDRANRSVHLSWKDLPPDHAGKTFYVERSTDSGNTFTHIGTVALVSGESNYSFDDVHIVPNVAYTYRVYAREVSEKSRYSNEAAAILANHPPDIAPIPTQFVKLGHEFEYLVDASDQEDGKNIHFELVNDAPQGAPSAVAAGMTIEEHTGLIHGFRPTALSEVGKVYLVHVRVTDPLAGTDPSGIADRTFALQVSGVGDSPIVLSNLTAAADLISPLRFVSLNVDAEDQNTGAGPLAYSWAAVSWPAGAAQPRPTAAGPSSAASIGLTAAGHYKFRVRVNNPAPLGVVAIGTVEYDLGAVAQNFTLTPSGAILDPGETETFTATRFDQFNHPMVSASGDISWGGHAHGNFQASSGEYTASSTYTGDDTLTATATINGQSQTLTATITIETSSLAISDLHGTPGADPRKAVLSATVTGEDAPFQYQWIYKPLDASLPAPVIDNPNDDAPTVTFSKAGTYGFRLIVHDDTGHRRIADMVSPGYVVGQVVTNLDVSPDTLIVLVNGRLPMSVTATDQFGDAVNITGATAQQLHWSVSGTGNGQFVEESVDHAGRQDYRVFQGPGEGSARTVSFSVNYTDSQANVTQHGTIAMVTSMPTLYRITSPVAPAGQSALIEKDTPVKAIISDGAANEQVKGWRLVATPKRDGASTSASFVIAAGKGSAGSFADNGVQIAMLHPANLPDGLYTLALEVDVDVYYFPWEFGGAYRYTRPEQSDPVQVQVRTDVKLGNLTLPFSDVSVSTTGSQPINLSRSYDSSRADTKGDFGFGWRSDTLDADYHTTARSGRYGTGTLSPLRYNDLVYITLPDGAQHIFAFRPEGLVWNPLGLYINYKPVFQPVDGSTATLRTKLGSGEALVLDGTEYYVDTTSGRLGYNAARSEFGFGYVLTTEDKTEYTVKLDSITGKGWVASVRDSNSNIVTYSDTHSSVADQAGHSISVERVDLGSTLGSFISRVTDGVNGDVSYTYNPDTGDLISVVDRTGRRTAYEYAKWMTVVSTSMMKAYAVIRDEQGQYWNGSGFVGYTPSDYAQYAIALRGVTSNSTWATAGASTTGIHTAAVPGGIPKDRTLTVTFYKQASSSPASGDAVIGTETKGWQDPRDHVLTSVIDPRGVRTLSATYEPGTGLLASLVDAYGKPAPMSHGGFDGDSSRQSVMDLSGNTTEFVYDAHGNVERQIEAVKKDDGTGAVAKYIVTVHNYLYAGPAAEWDGHSIVNLLQSSTDYQPFEIAGPDDEGLRYDPDVESYTVWVTNRTFEYTKFGTPDQGQISSETVRGPNGEELKTQYLNYDHGKPRLVIDPNGNKTEYDYDGAGNLKSVKNPAGETTHYTYTTGSGGLPAGLLLETYQYRNGVNGAKTTLSENVYYTASNPDTGALKDRLKSTTDAAGMTTFYMYKADGNVEYTYHRWVDPHNSSVARWVVSQSVYDAEGRVTETKQLVYKDGSPGNPNVPDGVLARDGDGIAETLLKTVDATHSSYDALGKVWKSVDRYGAATFFHYDGRGNLVRTLYADGTETRTTYDAMGRVEWATDRFASSTTVDPNTGVVTHEDTLARALATRTVYDSVGRSTGTVRAKNVSILIGVDDDLNLRKASDAVTVLRSRVASAGTKLSETKTEYDDKGRVHATTGADGRETVSLYYPNGQLKLSGVRNPDVADVAGDGVDDPTNSYWLTATKYESTRVKDNATGQPDHWHRQDVATDALGRATTTTYDDLGRATKVAYADQSYTTTSYTAYGETVSKAAQRKSTDPGAPIVTVSHYDEAGRLTSVVQPDPDGTTGPLTAATWTYAYDISGNQTEQVDPRSTTAHPIVTTFDYDELGQRVKRTLPMGEHEDSTYDAFGRVTKHVDFNGNATVYDYDTLPGHGGRLESELRYDPTHNPDAQPGSASERTEYTYDELGRRESVIDSTKAPSASSWTASVTTSYEYDPVTGGVIERTVADHVHDITRSVNYAYDPVTGRHLTTWTDSTSTDYDYDLLGRLKKVTVSRRNGVASEHLSSINDADPENVVWTYASGNDVANYTYDAVGNLKTVLLPNRLRTTYTYDTLNRLTDEKVEKVTVNTNGTQTVNRTVADYAYTLLSNGQRAYVIETTYNDANQVLSTVKADWTYDGWDRLTEEKRGTWTGTAYTIDASYYDTKYTYDLVGNRERIDTDTDGNTSHYEKSASYEYNDDDQLKSESDTGDGSADTFTVTYDYDANGSLTIKTVTPASGSASSQRYRYDLRNRLSRFDASFNGTSADDVWTNGSDLSFVYDAEANRIARLTRGGTTNSSGQYTGTWYVTDTMNPTGYAQVLEELNAATAPTSAAVTRTYDIGLDVIAQTPAPSTTNTSDGQAHASPQHLVMDGHGNTRVLTDSLALTVVTGTTPQRYAYEAYGNALGFNPNSATTKRLYVAIGGAWDAGLGMVHYNARDYVPTLGRFPTEDQLRYGHSDDPRTLHKYSYASADPENRVDPGGHESYLSIGVASAIQNALISTYLSVFSGVYFAAQMASARVNLGYAALAFTIEQAKGAIFDRDPFGLADRYLGKIEDALDPELPMGAVGGRYGLGLCMTYGQLRKWNPIWGLAETQANHINQDAAYRSKIPTRKGVAVNLAGSINEPGTPHYKFHEHMEYFYEEYRTGSRAGDLPTNEEYLVAVEAALRAAGLSAREAQFHALMARAQQIRYRCLPGEKMPVLPERIRSIPLE